MARRVKTETQKTVSDWAKENDLRTPDEVMHNFLDAVKDLEVVWFTGQPFEIFDHLGEVMAELVLTSDAICQNLQDALNAAMSRRRKGGQ